MEVKIFDAHTHTQFLAFKDDQDKVIKRALENGVGIINAGTNKKTSEDGVKIAYKFENDPVFACVGLHPLHTYHSFNDKNEIEKKDDKPEEKFDFDYYYNLSLKEKVLAIGECGLDYFRIKNDEEIIKKQKEAFLSQIELSFKVKKPLVIHCRLAYKDTWEILKDNFHLLLDTPGVMHFFAGSKEDAKKFLDLGFYFTFGGVITFTKDYNEVINYIPLNRILVETDAPYVAPLPFRGKRNEPLYVWEVIKKLAEIKNMPLEKTCDTVLENTKFLFKIK